MCRFKQRYRVGIDGGDDTGIAVYDLQKGLVVLETAKGIVTAINRLKELRELYEDSIFLIEEAALHGTIIYNRLKKKEDYAKTRIAENIGENRAYTKVIKEFLLSWECEVIPVKPVHSKLKAGPFSALTGFSGRCSQDARDACMLVYPPERYKKLSSKDYRQIIS